MDNNRELLIRKQNLTVQSQLAIGIVKEIDIDETGHPTGIYYVVDSGSGVIYKAFAIRWGNMKFVYRKGDQVVIALGVAPSNNVSCIILGQLAREYPFDSIPPSPMALDEGEIANVNPISKGGTFLYSDGLSELRGRIAGTTDTVSVLVGGLGAIFSIALNVGAKIVELTRNKLFRLFLNSVQFLITELFYLTAKVVNITTNKLIILQSDGKILITGEEAIATTTQKHEMYADEIKMGEKANKQYHKVARADGTQNHIQNLYNAHDTDLLPKLAALGVVINPITKTTSDIPSDTVEVD